MTGHESKRTTQTMLASSSWATGESTLNNYQKGIDSKPTICDLKIARLPADFSENQLK